MSDIEGLEQRGNDFTNFSSASFELMVRSLSNVAHAQEYLTAEEEKKLILEFKRDNNQKARERIIMSHMRLANALARKAYWHNRSNHLLSQEDLVQEAVLAMDKALSNFSLDKSKRFSTYATYWIRSYLQVYVVRNSFSVTVSTTTALRTLVYRYEVLRKELLRKDPTLAYNYELLYLKLAKELNSGIDVVKSISKLKSLSPLEIDRPIFNQDGDDSITYDLPDATDIASSVETFLDSERLQIKIQDLLAKFNERERFVIEKRYFIADGDPIWTYGMIGKALNVSKQRIKQIEERVLREMRLLLAGKAKPKRVTP